MGILPSFAVMLTGLVSAFLFTSGLMAKAPVFDHAREVVYVCSASGTEHLRPQASAAQVCAVFKRKVEAAIARRTRSANALPSRGNGLRIAVRIDSARSASAMATVMTNGRSVRHPELTIDVMDKSLGMRDLDLLATQIARKLF
jgi:hypothetical protein